MSSPGRKTVVAALDSSVAANPVLVAARALARVLGARVSGVHVATDGGVPEQAAAAAGVPLDVVHGPVVDRLMDAGRREEVAAVVLGARSSPTSPHTLGSTALAVVTSVPKPVVVVPPDGRTAPQVRRVLAPVEAAASPSLAPRSLIELAQTARIEIVALHVDDGEGEPLTDAEFLRRYCPWGIDEVRLERRVGRPEELVAPTAEELGCDLIALGWTQELEAGRAPVVRATLERSLLPIMLVPVEFRREAWEHRVVGTQAV